MFLLNVQANYRRRKKTNNLLKRQVLASQLRILSLNVFFFSLDVLEIKFIQCKVCRIKYVAPFVALLSGLPISKI